MKTSGVTELNRQQVKSSTVSSGAKTQQFNQVFNAALQKGNNQYDYLFQAAGEKWGVSPALLKAVAKAESGFNPNAVSKSGAQGIMQLMPKTARSLGVSNSFDPAESIFGAAKYLSSMLNRYDQNIKLALAAYNAGPGNVQKYGGVPPFAETQKYISKVLSYLDSGSQQAAAQNINVAASPPKYQPAAQVQPQSTPRATVTTEELGAEDSTKQELLWAKMILAEIALSSMLNSEEG
ncbi:lytic transglycosylase domain-containing protein [Bacillota bacterium LX-D]|nr:lytic transglycosylase domain-containing protein [Bacillota bacterium LX-D]